jgi:peptidyl-prolyl cis-trans isomerase C
VKHLLAYGTMGLACLMLPAAASAQGAPKSVSPATAIDLTKPQFDTQTPHYDVGGASDRAAGTVVADVGGRTVTLGMVGDAIRDLPPTVRNLPFDTVFPPLLKQLTQMQALIVRAQRQGLDKDPVVLRRAKLAYDNVLANAILVREAGAGITEKMLLDRYERDYGGKPGSDEADVSIVLLAAEAEANAVVAELAGGADFATIARRSSRDSSAQAGGHLGFQPQSVLSPEIGSVAFAMASGQTAPRPVRTAVGWFVVRVGERRQGARPAFAAVRDDLRAALLREAFPTVTDAAMRDTTVRTFDISGKEVQP